MSTIDQFKNNLLGGGARPNQFRVTGGFPSSTITAVANAVGGSVGGALGNVIGAAGGLAGNGANKIQFLCKAASIPQSEVGSVILPYRGKQLKVAGDRTFPSWQITIVNDTDFALRKLFEQWSNALTSHKSNIGANTLNYMQDWMVEQLDRSGGVLQTYHFRGCFPTLVGDITLSYDSTNTVEEYTVTIDYQYWENAQSTT